jgi:hypothetical protein
MEIPALNILSKCDLIKDKSQLDSFIQTDPSDLLNEIPIYSSKFKKMTEKISQVLSDFNLVNFLPLDVSDEESIANVMYQADICIQYGETLEVTTRDDMEMDC